jgi:hypothetical protein
LKKSSRWKNGLAISARRFKRCIQVLKDGVRQPTTQEINAAKAAYDALVAEGLELF